MKKVIVFIMLVGILLASISVAQAEAQTGYFGGSDPAPQPNLGYVAMYNSSSYLHLGNALSRTHNNYFVVNDPTQVGWLGAQGSGVAGRGHTSYYRHNANTVDLYIWEYRPENRRYCLWWARVYGTDAGASVQQLSPAGCSTY